MQKSTHIIAYQKEKVHSPSPKKRQKLCANSGLGVRIGADEYGGGRKNVPTGTGNSPIDEYVCENNYKYSSKMVKNGILMTKTSEKAPLFPRFPGRIQPVAQKIGNKCSSQISFPNLPNIGIAFGELPIICKKHSAVLRVWCEKSPLSVGAVERKKRGCCRGLRHVFATLSKQMVCNVTKKTRLRLVDIAEGGGYNRGRAENPVGANGGAKAESVYTERRRFHE